jgi:putative flippase GtrA
VPSTASSSTTSSVVGGIAAVVDIGLFMLFAQYFAMPYLRVAAASFLVATLVNYWLSIRFVFVSGQRFRRRYEMALVFAVSLAGLALNASILWMCVEHGQFPLLLAKLTATGVVFFWNFLARRILIFGALQR